MRIEQYLTHTDYAPDYALWEVIVNGDAPAIASSSAGTEGPIPPKTTKQKLARKNELKAKSTLLLAIPDEHILKFHGIKDAKTLWEAIKDMFGGNKESKKMQKTILKQQYENFDASRSERLDKTYNRFQKLISQLEIHGEVISQEDANLKLLRSLPSAWNNKNTSSTNEAVNTAHEVSTASSQGQASSSTYADDVMFSFFVNQSNTPQLDNQDLEQIDTDDLEEMDLKWQVAMLTMRVKRFLKKTERNLNFNGKETVGFDKKKVECYNCHGRGHFARKCRAPRNQGNKNGDGPRRNAPAEEGITNFALMSYTSQGLSSSSSSNSEIIGYQMGLESLEARIVFHEKNKVVYEEDIAFFKSLTKLINSQISTKDKAGLGYDSQMNKSEVVHSVFNSRESDVDNSPVNDRFKTGEGFHAVPPPYTGNYMPSRPDLSFAGLDDFVYKTKVIETITTASKTSKDNLEKPKIVRSSAPIIEDWDTDSDNDSVFRPKIDQTKLKFTKINFVKSDENVKSVNKENTHKQVEYPRKSQSPRGNRRNWNGMMTQKLGNEKPVLNNKGRVTGQREIRPVWNNVQRVNHQKKLTHPHPKRNFVPTAVATKFGQVPVNAAKQNSPRAAASISTARPVNIVALKSKVNDALPKTYSYFKTHSPVRRYFNQKLTAKIYNLNEKVKTARINNVTTAGPKAVVSAAVENRENVVKSSAYWIWRPTGNVIDHTSKDSGSHMFKRFDYVDLQGRLKNGYLRKGRKTKPKRQNRTRNGKDKAQLAVSPSVSAAGQSFTNADDLPTDPLMPDLEDTANLLNTGIFSGAYDDEDVGAEADLNNLETTMNVSPIPTTRIHKDHPKDQIIRDINSATQTRRMTKISEELAMKVWRLVDLPKGKHAIGTKWVYRNKKDERGIVVRNKARLVAQGYTQEEGIDYDEVFAPVARIEAIRLFLAYASFIGFIVYHMDVKSAFLHGTIEEEVYVCQPPGFKDPQIPDKVIRFRRGTIDKTLFIKKDKGDILLVQVYVDDIIFGSTKKSLCVEFE
ncbi:ribonuclease H-like domain-containing protein [Tanacetum coccineum]